MFITVLAAILGVLAAGQSCPAAGGKEAVKAKVPAAKPVIRYYPDGVKKRSRVYPSPKRVIIIEKGVARSVDIQAAIKDAKLFKRTGRTSVLSANLQIEPKASLILKGEKWRFNGKYALVNIGTLIIDKCVIDSVDPKQRGSIISATPQPETGHPWKPDEKLVFRLTNSNVSHLGDMVGAPHARQKWGIHANIYWKMAHEPPVIAGNEIHHCAMALCAKGDAKVINNHFHHLSGNGGIDVYDGVFEGNIVEDSPVNYLFVSWGGGCRAENNIFRNNKMDHHCKICIRLKMGGGGSSARHNLVYNFGIGHGIYLGSDNSSRWSPVEDNIIYKGKNGLGIMGAKVKARFLRNFVYGTDVGLEIRDDPNAAARGFRYKTPSEIVCSGNILVDNRIGLKALKGAEESTFKGNIVADNKVDFQGAKLKMLPDDKAPTFRIITAPAAVWKGGRISRITFVVIPLKPMLAAPKVVVKGPGGKKLKVSFGLLKETSYPSDYVGTFDTAACKIGKGKITITGRTKAGGKAENTATFEVRALPYK